MDEQHRRKRGRTDAPAPAAPAHSTVAAADAAAVNSLAASLAATPPPRSIFAPMQPHAVAVAAVAATPAASCPNCPPLREALARSDALVSDLQAQLSAARAQYDETQRHLWSLQQAAQRCVVKEHISYEPLRLVGGMRAAGDHDSHTSSSSHTHDTHSGRAKMRRTDTSRRSSDVDDEEGGNDLGGEAAVAVMPPSLPPLAAAAAAAFSSSPSSGSAAAPSASPSFGAAPSASPPFGATVSSTSSSSAAASSTSPPSSSGCGSTPSPTPALPCCRFCAAPGVYSMRHRSCDGREEELACYCASHESMVTRMLSQWQSQAWNGVDPKTKADCDSCWSSEQLERMLPPKTDEDLRAEALLTQRCHAFTSSGGRRPDWIAEDAVVHSRRLIGNCGSQLLPQAKSPNFAGSYSSIDDANPAVTGAVSGRLCAREDCCTRVDPLDDASIADSDSHALPALSSARSLSSTRSLSVLSATIDLHELLMVERSAVAESCARSLCEVDRRRHDRLFFFCHAHWMVVARLLTHSHPEHGPIQLRPHPRIKQQVFTLDQFLVTPDDAPTHVLLRHSEHHQPGKAKKKNKRSRSTIDEESAALAAASSSAHAAAAASSPALTSMSAPATVIPVPAL